MTVLPELLPLSLEMAKRKLTGIMNFTNPGAISHNEIMQVRWGAVRGVCRGRLWAGVWGRVGLVQWLHAAGGEIAQLMLGMG
jgi:hypothetical protein